MKRMMKRARLNRRRKFKDHGRPHREDNVVDCFWKQHDGAVVLLTVSQDLTIVTNHLVDTAGVA